MHAMQLYVTTYVPHSGVRTPYKVKNILIQRWPIY